MDSKKNYNSVDEYIHDQPEKTQPLLHHIRHIILDTAPTAKEIISYGMPAYKIHGVLVYFAANKNHIGFYPTGSPIIVFKDELSGYKTSKGAIQFPIKSGIPTDLVKKLWSTE
ncbi:MAG: DUF1801 domain-containing protein [Paludibacter sp.]|nr:DUF1801 domain-containing protein [Paludibacter sp.]